MITLSKNAASDVKIALSCAAESAEVRAPLSRRGRSGLKWIRQSSCDEGAVLSRV